MASNKFLRFIFILLTTTTILHLDAGASSSYKRRLGSIGLKKISQIPPSTMVPNDYWYKGPLRNTSSCQFGDQLNRYNSNCFDEYFLVIILYIIDQVKQQAWLDQRACEYRINSAFHPDDLRANAPVIGTDANGNPIYQFDDACSAGTGITSFSEYDNWIDEIGLFLNNCYNNGACTEADFDNLTGRAFFYENMITNILTYYAFRIESDDVIELDTSHQEVSVENSVMLDGYSGPNFNYSRPVSLPTESNPKTSIVQYPDCENIPAEDMNETPCVSSGFEPQWKNSEWCWVPITSEGIFRCKKNKGTNTWLPDISTSLYLLRN